MSCVLSVLVTGNVKVEHCVPTYMEAVGFGWLLPPTPLTVSDHISYVKSDSVSLFIFSTCTNSGVLSSTVLERMKLEILEPLPWLML